MNSESDDKLGVRISPESLVADWVRSRSVYFGRPLAALQRNARPEQVFIENEVLVASDDTDTLRYLKEQHGAEVIPLPPVPPQPEGMDPQRVRSVEGMPMLVRVRFQGERVPLEPLDALARQQPQGILQITSRAGAGTLALARRLAIEGRRVMPNLVGNTTALPLSASMEGPSVDGISDAYQWLEYAGSSNITRAWQLMQAYAEVRPFKQQPIYLGIFDAGFNLDGVGRPLAPLGQSPDFTNLVQYNLSDEGKPAGGPNNESDKPWHGNAVLSVATAPINNKAGAAGAGGIASLNGNQIVIPCLFKTFRDIFQVLRGLQLCVGWGIDVVNISFEITFSPLWLFPSTAWEENFQYAADKGVVVVVSAGNEKSELPETVIFPATRTPGVITVGALDTKTGNLAANFSNYGSSVDIWAPGTGIHAMPDPRNANGSLVAGTSFASPIVAGVAALMKSLEPTLKSGDIKQILRDTGYTNSPDSKVTVSLNAQAALLHIMGNRLPEGPTEEPNDIPQTAKTLSGPGGLLALDGPTTLSSRGDQDWYHFQVDEYSTLLVTLDSVPGLSALALELVPEDPQSRALPELQRSGTPGKLRFTVEQVAPGGYRLVVIGNGPNIYELRVKLSPNLLQPDIFEVNDTFEQAAQFTMKQPNPLFEPLRRFHQGAFEANLHVAEDVDYFHIQDIEQILLTDAIFRIDETDFPLDAALYGADRVLLENVQGVRSLRFKLPTSECWIRISGTEATRYMLKLRYEFREGALPGPWQKENVSPIPGWWPDPPFVLNEWEKFLQVQISNELKNIGKLRLTGSPGLTMELLSQETGTLLVSGTRLEGYPGFAVEMDLSGVEPGAYIVRVGRNLHPTARLDPAQSKSLAQFNLGPAW